MNKVLVLHFTHPEGYPPALNAINCLSERVDSLKIITTDTLPTNWKYDANVRFALIEGEHDRFEFVKRSKLVKLNRYFQYISLIRSSIKIEKPNLVVIYDNVPFLLYLFATLFLRKKHKLWVHNHDIYPGSHYSKYSINWFSFYAIQKFFNQIDCFSLPALERKKMFPLDQFKGKFFFIPNYPSKKIINTKGDRRANWNENKHLKVVYPGSPSIKNGFEELIKTMNVRINEKLITLTIVGETNTSYKNDLYAYAKLFGVEDQLFFVNRVPYTEMPNFLSNYHIGWGMYKPLDLSVATAGTSSNKIYEFLANAMPIVVYDNEHHRQHLSNTAATFFSDLSTKSIRDLFVQIDANYTELSAAALSEFNLKYKFEQRFDKVADEILN
jgi:glycosyltransferase involved in cell wall biosynthesis